MLRAFLTVTFLAAPALAAHTLQFPTGVEVYCADEGKIAHAQKALARFQAKVRKQTYGVKPNADGEYILQNQVNPTGGPRTSFRQVVSAEVSENPLSVYVALSSDYGVSVHTHVIFGADCSASQ